MDYFSQDYLAARHWFRSAADRRSLWTDRLEITGTGPDEELLTVDIAWLGDRTATRILLHTSGLHGVEGFAGSAIQLQLLDEPPVLAADCALVLVHILNPYGMAWLRRANGANVDLNRNFIFSEQQRQGAAKAYEMLDPLLNPPYPPRIDGFYPRALYFLMRYGYRHLKAAIACGQYSFPHGLFFGGAEPQPEVLTYRQWLKRNLSQAKRLLVVDVHTGLGKAGQEALFHSLATTPTDILSRQLDSRVVVPATQDQVLGYQVLGGHQEVFRKLLPDCVTDFITQEFGTKPALEVLQALRAENQWHHHGTGKFNHPAKQALKSAFCLPSARWQQQVGQRGARLVQVGLGMLADHSS